MKAPAKINLFLKVTGVRDDGYHTLENVYLPIPELYDDISLEANDGLGVSIKQLAGPVVPTDRTNLCMKAADAFATVTGLCPNVTILLSKRIPIAAGLGGGSSDAAAVLKLLNDHCGKPLSDEKLHDIAVKLGADVPFFLNPMPALGLGIGEILSPKELNCRMPLLIVTPNFQLPVAWSFNHLKSFPQDSQPQLDACLKAMKDGDIEAIAANCRNDLEHAVFEKFPILQIIREAMIAAGALTVHLSGSGPSLFAIAQEEKLSMIAEAASKFINVNIFRSNQGA